MNSIFVSFHIICGALALSSGTVALATRKGDTIHRAAGKAFVVTMALMATTGAVLAYPFRVDGLPLKD